MGKGGGSQGGKARAGTLCHQPPQNAMSTRPTRRAGPGTRPAPPRSIRQVAGGGACLMMPPPQPPQPPQPLPVIHCLLPPQQPQQPNPLRPGRAPPPLPPPTRHRPGCEGGEGRRSETGRGREQGDSPPRRHFDSLSKLNLNTIMRQGYAQGYV